MHGAKTIFYELLAIIYSPWNVITETFCDVKNYVRKTYHMLHMAVIYSVIRTAWILAQNLNLIVLSSNGQHRSAHRMV